jgi:superfamily II DNA or RNA helicase
MQINKHKLARQEIGVEKAIENFKKGLGATWEYCTGFGKTFCAFLLIDRMIKNDPNKTTIVIVPTDNLKDQWERQIKKRKLKNIRVFVVNGITINQTELECDLFILDEAHRYASDVFSRVFNIKYRWLLNLTATIDRLDGLHSMLLEKAPIVDTITLQEAKRNGWVSDYIEYNLGLELTEEDRIIYDDLNRNFNKLFGFFGHNFPLVKACTTTQGSRKYADENNLSDKMVLINALNCMRFMRERKSFLYATIAKQEATLEIIKKFPFKTLTFAESTDFADKLTQAINNELGDIAISFHSKLKSQIIDGKKFGVVKLKKELLRRFVDNRYRIRIVNTAKALDQGSDFPDVMIGIIASSTSNPTQHTQRVGRILRDFINKYGDKKLALIINLFIRNSQDEKWLKKRQTNPKTGKPINPNVIEISSIEEIEYGTESLHISATG